MISDTRGELAHGARESKERKDEGTRLDREEIQKENLTIKRETRYNR